jgi:beta-glucosidase
VAQLERLSLEEKVALLSGRDTWTLPGLPAIGLEPLVMSDGATGVKGGDPEPLRSATIPCGTALAASWNPELIESLGSLLGETARAKGVHVLLAPATNIMRSPLQGRNFEYYSEGPLLAGRIACAYVRGVQSEGVAATVKHFLCNDAETGRMDCSVVVDEQPLREIYLLPFELALREAGAWAVMCSYNKLHGIHLSAHPILDDVLRSEWGFDGVVVSDRGAVHDTVGPGLNGLDVEMPGPPRYWGERLVAAVRAGAVAEARIDEKVARILRARPQDRRARRLAPRPRLPRARPGREAGRALHARRARVLAVGRRRRRLGGRAGPARARDRQLVARPAPDGDAA